MVTQSKLAVILHADVVGSTALVQQDERIAHNRIQDAFRRLAATVLAFRGNVREIRGDALLADFDRASDAVTGALAFQAANEPFNSALADSIRPEIRIGIALGEVVIADATVTGAGVVLAQRLEQLAVPNGVIVQGAVYETVPRRLPLNFENLGEHTLKGFRETFRVYGVTLQDGVSLPTPEAQTTGGETDAASTEHANLAGTSGPSVAVLPFRNLSGDSDQEFFADGLSQDIILALSASRSFPVVASSSTFSYKGRSVDAQIAGNELGAQYVLDGSVRRSGNRLRVSVELVSVDTRRQLWSERYDRSVDDLFAVQDDVSANVAAIVEPEIDLHEMRRVLASPPASMDAYELAQRGFWHLSRRSKDDHLISRKLFEKALDLDPAYARAYTGLGWGKWLASRLLWEDPRAAIEESLRLSQTALNLDDRDPRALRWFGAAATLLRRHDDALRTLRRAIALHPSYATAYSGLAFALDLVGDFDDALTAEATTARLRPGDRSMHICMMSKAIAKYQKGDYESAEAVSRESLDLNDSFWMSHLLLVAALGQQGRAKDGVSAIDQVNRLVPDLTEEWLSEHLPFRESVHLDQLVEGLRRAQLNL